MKGKKRQGRREGGREEGRTGERKERMFEARSLEANQPGFLAS